MLDGWLFCLLLFVVCVGVCGCFNVFGCFVNDASCVVVWLVSCALFMSVCDCLVWLCGVFLNDCVMLYVACVGACGLRCACGLCGVLRDAVWCVCLCAFLCACW